MKNISGIPQLILRVALGMGFLMPVLDRIGWLGDAKSGKDTWGDWPHFVNYTNTLLPFLNHSTANIAALFATILEVTFGIFLIVGFRIKLVALSSAILTITFALCMAVFVSPLAPLNYPVLVFTGAGLVLSCIHSFKWSIDELISSK